MDGYIDVKELSMNELAGVINLYPWFGLARKEMYKRMCGMGLSSDEQYSDSAMYIGTRSKLSDIVRAVQEKDWTDGDVEELVKMYISEEQKDTTASEPQRVYAGVGDYFSQADYAQVKKSEDNVFSHYAAKARQEKTSPEEVSAFEFDIYTQTLAEIYLEQGYPEQAKRIYSKLILAYPEKSAYFASLIEKIDKII